MQRLNNSNRYPLVGAARAACVLVLALCAAQQIAAAQDVPPAQPPDAPAPAAPSEVTPAAPPPVAQPAPPPTPPPTQPVVSQPATVAASDSDPEPTPAPAEAPVEVAPAPLGEAGPLPAEEEPPAEAETPAPLNIGAWLHIGTHLSSFEDPEELDRVWQDAELDLIMGADLTDGFGLQANLVGTYGPTYDPSTDTLGGDIQGSVALLDLHAKIGVDDAFNVWIGRMLVPSDRSNFSGFWFAAPWSYPGFYDYFSPPTGPRQGPFGRNDGVTLWGQFGGGLFKYYASAFELYNGAGTALFSGRLNLSLINPEPGYYHSSTYYGGKDLLALAIGGQYQKDGSGTDDYSEFNADLLYERNLGEGGVVDLEGAFYKYMGDGEAIDFSYFVVASWMTAHEIGVGKIQPLVRLQQRQPTADGADLDTLLDLQLGYVVDTYATRFALTYTRSKVNDIDGNSVVLGVQLQK